MTHDDPPDCYGEYLKYRKRAGCSFECRYYNNCVYVTKRLEQGFKSQ